MHSGVATIVPIGDDSGRLTLYLSDENIGSLSFDERTRSEIAILGQSTRGGSSSQAIIVTEQLEGYQHQDSVLVLMNLSLDPR